MATHATPRSFQWSERHTIAYGVGLLSLGLSLWQLTKPGFFSFSDSGVYLAASIHLIYRSVPYQDFVFVQPPGIMLIMSPVAIISRIFGSHDGFVVARVLSALVTALNATLLAWLVRHRGRAAMLIAGGGLALLPVASFVSTGVILEPYLIFFVLLGSLTVFPYERARTELSTRRLKSAGLFFGLAALVKLWAFFPFLALVICLAPRYRLRVLYMIRSAVVWFVALCLPFYVLAGNKFISQVFVEQLTRRANVTNDGGVIGRLITMTGFSNTSLAPSATEVIIAFAALAAIVALAFTRRARQSTVDNYLLVAALVSVGGLLIGPDSYTYYGYFTAPFLLGLLGVSLGRLSVPIRRVLGTQRASKGPRRFGYAAYIIVAAALVVALIMEGTSFYSSYTNEHGYSGVPFSAITNLIPAGACVVYDQVSYGVFANRLQSNDPNCPNVVDPYGIGMAWSYQLSAPAPALVAEWKSYLEAAQYVVLSSPYASGIPLNQSLETWFNSNYYLLFGQSNLNIYMNRSTS